MNFLTRLDPGYAATRVMLSAFVQSSVVIMLAALAALFVFSRCGADVRHALWLGALIWALLSPVATVVADGLGIARWFGPLPVPGMSMAAAHDEPISAAAVIDTLQHSDGGTTNRIADDADGNAVSVALRTEEMGERRVNQAVAGRSKQAGNAVAGGLTLLWAAGLLIGLMRIALGWRRLWELSRVTRPIDSVRHGIALDRVRAALRVPALPPIVTSATAARAGRGGTAAAPSGVAGGPGRVDLGPFALRRARSRMRPCPSPRRVGRACCNAWPARCSGRTRSFTI